MGRKSKRNSRRNQDFDVQGKQKIARLLDDRKIHHKEVDHKKTTKSEAYLKKRFEPLFEKFQSPEDNSSKQIITYHDEEKPIEATQILEEVEKPSDDQHLSKRRVRKASKPTLYELKKSVPYPQLIDWYDCDAQYPQLQAYIKASKNIVAIPVNWQSKKEYLSGRSLLDKKPFELPEIIKDTDIEQLRQVMPDEKTKESTLKETTRARVQPKVGTLDIDYKKLHDVFFKLGSNWKPDILLPFGDLYYEGRNLSDEAKWKKLVKEKRPGHIGTELRSAMGLDEGQLPPWCMKMKSIGMPPSYPDLKIAGLNWGIENLRGNTYGTLSAQRGTKDKIKYFGQLIVLENHENPGEDKEQDQESVGRQNNVILEAERHMGNAADIERRADVEVQKVEKGPVPENRPLYTVIQEKKSDIATSATGSRSAYVISNENDVPELRSNPGKDPQPDNEQDRIDRFKF